MLRYLQVIAVNGAPGDLEAEFYANEKGLNVNTILGRVFRGWELEDAVSMDNMGNTERYKGA